MNSEAQALVFDLVEWIAARPRPYAEVMEAWRTSCPRLTVSEDALEQGYVARADVAVVRVTAAGVDLLVTEGRLPSAAASALTQGAQTA